MDLISRHSAVDITVNPLATPDAETFLRQVPPPLNDGWINSWPSGITAYTHDHQVSTGAGWPQCTSLVSANADIPYPVSLQSTLQSTLIWHSDEGAGTLLPTTSTHYGELPVVRPSSPMGWATFTWFPLSAHASYTPLKSTLVMGESEALDPAPVVLLEAPTYINVAYVDRIRNWDYEDVPMNVPSDQALRCTRADTTTYFSGPSAFPGFTSMPVECQDQRPSQDRLQNFQEAVEGSAVASSQSSRRQADSVGKGPNSCNIQGCSKTYVQLQGLRRHYQEKHAPSLCRYCGAFEWGRRYLLKKHIGERHPDIDPNIALVEATRARRRATT